MDIGILVVGFIVFVIGLWLIINTIRYKNKIASKVVEDWREELYEEVEDTRKEKDELVESYYAIIKRLEDTIEIDQQRAVEAHESAERVLNAERQRTQSELEGMRTLEEERIKSKSKLQENQLDIEFDKRWKEMEEFFNSRQAALEEDFSNKQNAISTEIIQLQNELEEFRAKRAALNEAIRLEEEAENEADFRRIHLSQNDKEDISYLLSIENRLTNKEVLRKLIWTEFLQKPFNQTLKNVLGGRSPKNVIYCIENINSHKKYIGKTAGEVSKRWTEHIKSSLSIGTISHQVIHDALYGHWDEFTFSIIEEVKDDKLSDREKFYISTFQSDKYGYNSKAGG